MDEKVQVPVWLVTKLGRVVACSSAHRSVGTGGRRVVAPSRGDTPPSGVSGGPPPHVAAAAPRDAPADALRGGRSRR